MVKARSRLPAAVLMGMLAVLLSGCASGETRVVVAAGTTLVDGGLLEAVAADYQVEHPDVMLSVVGVPTARALALARAGSADVTITHDPQQEERFLADGGAELAVEVFSSRFILAGPAPWAETLEGLTAAQAFERISQHEYLFVSRADGSGTYQAERRIWAQAGLNPESRNWYLQTRQGMGITLQVASQKQGFVLVEWSVLRAAQAATDLVEARLRPAGLNNPYLAIAVKGSSVGEAAVEFVSWLGSEKGRESIRRANRLLYGSQVFEP